MKLIVTPALAGALALLAGCGDGGGIASTPTPPASPTPTPTPTNSTITNLQASQTFAADRGSTTASFDLTARTTTSAASEAGTIQVSYDAGSRGYTVTAGTRSQAFLSSDITAATTNPGETRYQHVSGSQRDYLTLVTTPYSGNTANRYVGLGYWQRNLLSGNTQNTTFDAFTYGLETPSRPVSGTAGYATDNFAFVTVPGKAPAAFIGAGTFSVDFGLGVFTTSAYVSEYDLTTDRSVSGGGVQLISSGHLGSGNGFSGALVYEDTYGRVTGTLAGRFYGPNADELGASFSATNASGSAISGALTGQRGSTVTPANLSLTNLTSDQLFYSFQGLLSVGASRTPGMKAVNLLSGIGQVTQRTDGSFLFTPANSGYANADFLAADRITGEANYTTYQKTVNGTTTRLALYRPGSANTELALTYASFGAWSGGAATGYEPFDGRIYFTYGIPTPTDLLSRRTGTATYTGVAHGAGAQTDGTLFDVGGTAQFAVDFSAQRFSGALALNARPTAGGATRDLGNWTFADVLASGQLVQTGLSGNPAAAAPSNLIAPRFYGPDGEEIAATFALRTGRQDAADTIAIVGAAVAKR